MSRRCIVGGCSNVSTGGISLHRWPKEPNTRKLWTKFVQNTRADFNGPTRWSEICSEHFEDDAFDPSFQLKTMLGFTGQQRKILLGKFPTMKTPKSRSARKESIAKAINVEAMPTSSCSVGTSYANISPPADNNTVNRPSSSGACTDTSSTTTRSSPPATPRHTSSGSSTCNESTEPRPKKKRVSSEYRSRKKDVDSIIEEEESRKSRELEDRMLLEVVSEFELKTLNCVDVSCQTKPTREPQKVYRRSVGLQVKPVHRTKGTQTTEEMQGTTYSTTATQCTSLKPLLQQVAAPSPTPSDPSDVETEVNAHERMDTEYQPGSEGMSTDDEFKSEDEGPQSPWEEDKFIVFKSCLMMLFSVCIRCAGASSAVVKTNVGSLIIVLQRCRVCGWKRTWTSQPYCRGLPAGNLFLSACILFAGASATKVLRVLQFFRCQAISTRTFLRHQKAIIQPAIIKTWEAAQQCLIHDLEDDDIPLVLGGDARADSPGHTAKFGSYTLMELRKQKVLDVILVQKNEVSSSNAMELEGLKRAVSWLFDSGLMEAVSIECIITDRHLQVAKWIRENLTNQNIQHYYDVWHIAKSIKKKLKAIASRKGCEVISEWQQSIINHVYWTASSTPTGDGKLMLEKFLSIENHVQNLHTGHQGEVFTQCAHAPLSPEAERAKKWLEPGTEACEKLSTMVNQRHLHSGIKQMSPKEQTSSVEAFHSLILHFAPKQFVFSYEGMTCRLLLAAMHYNENAVREQAKDRKGDPAFRLEFPRAKCGGYTLRKVPVKATFDYVNTLLRETHDMAESTDRVNPEDVGRIGTAPVPLTHAKERPPLEEAIRKHYKRFNTGE